MSKPGQQSKSGAPRKPPTKPQRHPSAPVGPPPRTVARLWPYIRVSLAIVIIGSVLLILGRTRPVNELLIRIGWKDPPSTLEAQ